MDPRTEALEALAARIAAGEALDTVDLPELLLGDPDALRLLALSRVAHQLGANTEREPDDAPPTPPGHCGPFETLRLLGAGGMGEVWLAQRRGGDIEQRVALKRVRSDLPQFAARLREERRLLALLQHANIARFLDAGVDDRGAPWLALEYVDGEPVTDYCRRHALGLRERVALLAKICGAVDHAHRHLIVHRDLKPANVLVGADGEPKLLDFGIARLLDGSARETTAAALTPAYAAPEQLRGGVVSTATDVYALGLLAFRLLAGALPATRSVDNAAQVLAGLDTEETQRPSRVARGLASALPYDTRLLEGDLDAIVAQAIRGDPEARYGTAAALGEDLRRYLEARPVSARAPTRRYRLGRFVQRNRIAVALGTVAALALLAGTVIATVQSLRAEREAAAARAALVRAERVSDFLASLYREQDPLRRVGASPRAPAELLAEAVARVQRELADDPATAARLLRVLGEAQLNSGAVPAARATLDAAVERLGDDAEPELRWDLDALRGQAALRELRNEDAEVLFARALALASATTGADSVAVARVQARRAVGLVVLSKFREAREAAGAAHRILSRDLGPGSPEAIDAAVTLGLVQEQLREDVDAQTTLRSAIAAIEARFGPDDVRLCQPIILLGEVLRRARGFEEAGALLARGAAIARARLGERSALLARLLTQAAANARDAGALDDAIEKLDAAWAAVPDGETGSRAQVLATRGAIRLEQGDGARAEPDLREALRLRRESGGERTGLAWFAQAQLGDALSLQGRFDEAHALQAEAAERLRALLGPDAYQNALIAQRRGAAFARQRDWVGAAAQYRETLRLVEKTYGPDAYGSFETRLELASALAELPAERAAAREIIEALVAQWIDRPEAARRISVAVTLLCRIGEGKVPARQLLAREGLVADDAQRGALRACAGPS
jgi:serine/threonine-protein kinase